MLFRLQAPSHLQVRSPEPPIPVVLHPIDELRRQVTTNAKGSSFPRHGHRQRNLLPEPTPEFFLSRFWECFCLQRVLTYLGGGGLKHSSPGLIFARLPVDISLQITSSASLWLLETLSLAILPQISTNSLTRRSPHGPQVLVWMRMEGSFIINFAIPTTIAIDSTSPTDQMNPRLTGWPERTHLFKRCLCSSTLVEYSADRVGIPSKSCSSSGPWPKVRGFIPSLFAPSQLRQAFNRKMKDWWASSTSHFALSMASKEALRTCDPPLSSVPSETRLTWPFFPRHNFNFDELTSNGLALSAPLRLALARRMIHSSLTGPEAQDKDKIDENSLKVAWSIFDHVWSQIKQPGAEAPTVANWKMITFESSGRAPFPR